MTAGSSVWGQDAWLSVDDDQDVSKIVAEVLGEEAFVISELRDAHPAAILNEVARPEPDVVLLDGGDGWDYGYSWVNAAWMRERSRPIPVIMFTAHLRELDEAQSRIKPRLWTCVVDRASISRSSGRADASYLARAPCRVQLDVTRDSLSCRSVMKGTWE